MRGLYCGELDNGIRHLIERSPTIEWLCREMKTASQCLLSHFEAAKDGGDKRDDPTPFVKSYI